jgi:hypothetical protein
MEDGFVFHVPGKRVYLPKSLPTAPLWNHLIHSTTIYCDAFWLDTQVVVLYIPVLKKCLLAIRLMCLGA